MLGQVNPTEQRCVPKYKNLQYILENTATMLAIVRKMQSCTFGLTRLTVTICINWFRYKLGLSIFPKIAFSTFLTSTFTITPVAVCKTGRGYGTRFRFPVAGHLLSFEEHLLAATGRAGWWRQKVGDLARHLYLLFDRRVFLFRIFVERRVSKHFLCSAFQTDI